MLPEALRHAFRVATSGKMGPVMIDIPRDLLPGAEIELDLLAPDAYRPGQTRSRGDQSLIDKAAAVFAAAAVASSAYFCALRTGDKRRFVISGSSGLPADERSFPQSGNRTNR